MIMSSVDKERTDDYWLEATRLADKYRKDPKIQKKENLDAIMYWGMILVFCLFLAPLFLLFLLWFNFGEGFGYVEFLFSPSIKVVWILISVVGIPLSTGFIPKPERHSWNMAMKELDDSNVPFRHKEI